MKKLFSIVLSVFFVVACAATPVTKPEVIVNKPQITQNKTVQEIGVLKEGAVLARDKSALDVFCVALGSFQAELRNKNMQEAQFWNAVMNGMVKLGYLGLNDKEVPVDILRKDPQPEHMRGSRKEDVYNYLLIDHPIHGKIWTVGIFIKSGQAI